MNAAPPARYRFGDFRLDAGRRELTGVDGATIALTGKAFEVLLCLVEQAPEMVSKDVLLEQVWQGRVVEENTLTQAVSTLRKALGTDAGSHRFILTEARRGYRFVAEVQREAAPTDDIDASRPTSNVPPERSSRSHGLRWSAAAIVVLAAVAVLATIALRDRSPGARQAVRVDTTTPTLAVLPFRSIGDRGSPEADSMLDLGMADTLITRLSRTTSLRVLPLGSVQAFRGSTEDPMRTGAKLGADYLVDGSTQLVGDMVRVNARLVSLPDGRTVWAGTFDQVPQKVFTLQDALADGMSSALSLRYARAASYRSACDGSDPDAYRAYLRGRDLINRPDPARLPQAIAAFQDAIGRDPGCARAWAGIAFAYRSLAMTGDRDPRELMPLAKAAVSRALAIDPESAEAYASKGFVEFWYDWNWGVAEASLRRSIALNGNLPEAHYALAHLLLCTGRAEEALPHARKATLLDPLSPLINSIVASFFLYAGDGDEAARRLHGVLELNPDFWLALMTRGSLELQSGDTAAAIADLRSAVDRCGGCSHPEALLVRAYVRSGDRAAARGVLARMLEQRRTGYMPPVRLSLAYEALGDRERALDLLERGYRDRDIYMTFLLVDPNWASLRREPRFVAVLRRMHFPAQQER